MSEKALLRFALPRNLRFSRVPILVLVSMLVGACAPMMVAPKGPTATLTFTTTETFPIGIFHPVGPMDRWRCSKDKPEGIGTFNNRALGGGIKTQRFDVQIPASGERFRFFAPISLQGVLVDPGAQRYEYRVCVAHIDFLPQTDMHYLVEVEATADRCSMHLKRVNADKNMVEEPSQRVLPPCFPQGMVSSTFEKDARQSYERNPELYR